MYKKSKLTRWAFLLLIGCIADAQAVEWKITALTPKYILVQADITQDEQVAFASEPRVAEVINEPRNWKIDKLFREVQAEMEKNVRAPFAESLKTIPGFCSYWPEANGAKRYRKADGSQFSIKAGEVIHNVFVKVPTMKKGAEIDLGMAGKFTYDPSVPTPIFKVNQVGYIPTVRKFAYVGDWLGLTGPLPLKQFAGKEFKVINAKNNDVVYTGTLTLRGDDPEKNGTPFVGEEVLEIDLTALNKEGTYYLAIDDLGRSMDFNISNEAIVTAWGHHMQGLFNKRCGIEKKEPWTKWPSEACHLNVYRGLNPSDQGQYGWCISPADGKEILDNKGKPVKFNHFPTIQASMELCDLENPIHIPGGYHDAADYDRRPMHLIIPRALSISYLINPDKFFDGQLTIPESGNGIPDILDEAYWGIKHLQAAQQEDGGVGTWIETTGHPGGDTDSPERDSEYHKYFIARPTHDSCYDYAGTAALVARAFKAAGQDQKAQELLESAKRAWDWAQKNPPVVQKLKGYVGKWVPENAIDVVYTEPEKYEVKPILTAALNLSAMTGDLSYFAPVVARLDDLKQQTNKSSWGWNPFDFMEFGFKDQPIDPGIEPYRKDFMRRRINEADSILETLETAYPYRMPWYPSDHKFVHTMSWGNSHPFRRAQILIAAHFFTGESKYLDAVYLANDFHNGANPNGQCLTSGMGVVYPVKFLELQSVADKIPEYVAGITPYRWNFGVNMDAKNMVYGWDNINKWPFFRRFANVEQYSVAASEYTVWETILPPAAVLSYILPEKQKVPSSVYEREPADDISKLPGYWVKP